MPPLTSWSYHPTYDQLRQAIQALNAGLVVRGLDGKILFANDRMLAWLGYSNEELNGMEVVNLMPEEIRPLVEKEMRDVEEGCERARVTVMQRKDSRTFPVVTAAHALREDGQPLAVVTVIMDLGEVETAKRVGPAGGTGLAASLQRIAGELRTISLFAGVSDVPELPHDHPDLESLSQREREVLTELLAGTRVPAMAKKLFISPHTVRNHLNSMYRKLGVADQGALIERVRSLARNPDEG